MGLGDYIVVLLICAQGRTACTISTLIVWQDLSAVCPCVRATSYSGQQAPVLRYKELSARREIWDKRFSRNHGSRLHNLNIFFFDMTTGKTHGVNVRAVITDGKRSLVLGQIVFY